MPVAGNTRKWSEEFVGEDGPFDPDVVTFKLKLMPSGPTAVYTGAPPWTGPEVGSVQRDGVGLYHIKVVEPEHGVYIGEWSSTSPVAVVSDPVVDTISPRLT